LTDVITSSVEAAQPLINERGHRLVLERPESPIYFEADPHRLAQVLSNLLNNAARYTPEHGEIRLGARLERGMVEIHVQDNGIGIPPDKHESIFEMFEQIEKPRSRSYTGLGLGLTLAKLLVELHDGRIDVHSEGRGKGSRFTVCL